MKLTLRAKFMVALIVILLMSIATIVFTLYSSQLGKNLFNILSSEKMTELEQMLTLNQKLQESTYLTNLFIATKDPVYLETLSSVETEAYDVLDQMDLDENLKKVMNLVEERKKSSEVVFKLLEEEGSYKVGLLGNLRVQINDVEVIVENQFENNPHLEVAYLDVRDDEKDYVNRRAVKYLKKVKKKAEKMYKIIDKDPNIKGSDEVKIRGLLEKYYWHFDTIEKNYRTIKEEEAKIVSIQTEIRSLLEQRRESLEASINDFETESTTAFDVINYSALFIGVSSLLLFGIFFRLTRKLATTLENATENINSAINESRVFSTEIRSVSDDAANSLAGEVDTIQDCIDTVQTIEEQSQEMLNKVDEAVTNMDKWQINPVFDHKPGGDARNHGEYRPVFGNID